MNGTSKKLVGVYKTYTPINSIYNGDVLVWGLDNLQSNLVGKFADEANDVDYWYYSNSSTGSQKKITVNESTKGFNMAVSDIPFFTSNKKLKEIISYPDLSTATTMYQMFQRCEGLTSINEKAFNTENITNMAGAFDSCYSLTSLDLSSWNTSKVTGFSYMFEYCIELVNLNLSGWDVTNIRVFNQLFNDCYKLETLNLDGWDFSNAIGFSNTFLRCNSLTNVVGTIKGIKANIDLSYSPLTNASAMVFINGLETITQSRTIKFSAITYSTLTDEQKNIATSKGWTITHA